MLVHCTIQQCRERITTLTRPEAKAKAKAKKGNEKRIFPLTFIFISYFVSIILFGIFHNFALHFVTIVRRRGRRVCETNVCSTVFYEQRKHAEFVSSQSHLPARVHSYRIDGDFLAVSFGHSPRCCAMVNCSYCRRTVDGRDKNGNVHTAQSTQHSTLLTYEIFGFFSSLSLERSVNSYCTVCTHRHHNNNPDG